MNNLKVFEDFNQIDMDEVQRILTDEHGWGDLIGTRFLEFEESEYYHNPLDEVEYAEQMHKWLYGIQTGELEEPDFEY